MKARTIVFAVAMLALGACAQTTMDNQLGGETNWMVRCDSDAACETGSCLCGVCTVPCESAGECSAAFSGSCVETSTAVGEGVCASQAPHEALCLPNCDGDDDCGADFACRDAVCVTQVAARRVDDALQLAKVDASTASDPLEGNHDGEVAACIDCDREVQSLECVCSEIECKSFQKTIADVDCESPSLLSASVQTGCGLSIVNLSSRDGVAFAFAYEGEELELIGAGRETQTLSVCDSYYSIRSELPMLGNDCEDWAICEICEDVTPYPRCTDTLGIPREAP